MANRFYTDAEVILADAVIAAGATRTYDLDLWDRRFAVTEWESTVLWGADGVVGDVVTTTLYRRMGSINADSASVAGTGLTGGNAVEKVDIVACAGWSAVHVVVTNAGAHAVTHQLRLRAAFDASASVGD